MKFTAKITRQSPSSIGIVIPHEIVKKLKLKSGTIRTFEIEENVKTIYEM